MKKKEYGLKTLESRRLRDDQTEVFKILKGYENIEKYFFSVKEERKFSFSQRTVNDCNRLSADYEGTSSVNLTYLKIKSTYT